MFNRITLVAHRGYSSRAPENTLAAFSLAIAHGYKDIEFDVQLSKDNVPVIMHDETLERTTDGSGYVFNHTYAELKKLDAGSWFGPEFKNESVPSLREVLQLLKGKACVHIELKKNQPELPVKVADLLRSTGWLTSKKESKLKIRMVKPKIIISSQDRAMLLASMKILPTSAKHEIIVEKFTEESFEWAIRHGLFSYHPDGNDITPELIRKAKNSKLRIGAWWWTEPEQNVQKIKGARYAFVDALHRHKDTYKILKS